MLRHYPAGDLQQRAGVAEGDQAARDAGRSRVPDWQPGRPGRLARGAETGRGRLLQGQQNRQVFRDLRPHRLQRRRCFLASS